MEKHHRRFAVAYLLCLGFAELIMGQAAPQGNSPPKAPALVRGNAAAAKSPEEKLVRAAYAKLTAYSAAAQLYKLRDKNMSVDDDSVMRFELRNFRTGPVEEILNKLHRDLTTLPSDEVIQMGRRVSRENDEEEQASYFAEWVGGQYASFYDRQWTIGDLLRLEAVAYYDIGKYTSYEVTVHYQGKSRTYRALTLFHNPYGSAENLKPEFWDSVVGMGGSITRVWEEKRQPFGSKRTSAPGTDVTPPPINNQEVPGNLSDARSAGDEVTGRAVSAEYGSMNTAERPLIWHSTDGRDHASGEHYGYAEFVSECLELQNNRQRCKVSFPRDPVARDSGVTTNWIYHHVGYVDVKNNSKDGPRGMNIACESGVGVAFKYCPTTNCTFSVTVTIEGSGLGASASVEGGDLWKSAKAHGNICNIPSETAGGGCTTPGWGGSCPPDTYPNGPDACCSGSCGGVGALAPSFATAEGEPPGPNLAEGGGPGGCACDGVQRNNCFSSGGDWDDRSCSCASPLLIDVAGDGFRMTDGAGGVDFDFFGDGTRERMSWTQAGSDDAWLAPDRAGGHAVHRGDFYSHEEARKWTKRQLSFL